MTASLPIVQPISYRALLPQFLALSGALAVGWSLTRTPLGILLGALAYLLAAAGIRALLLRRHRQGVRLLHAGQPAAALPHLEESCAFFQRHAWLDRWRSVALMSPVAASYRELALLNSAIAHAQLGQADQARACCTRALSENPGSALAQATLAQLDAPAPT